MCSVLTQSYSGWPQPCCQALRICEAPCRLSGQMSRVSSQKQIRQKVRTAKMQCFGCWTCRKWFRSHLQVALPLWCAQAASFLTSASSWVAWVAWHSVYSVLKGPSYLVLDLSHSCQRPSATLKALACKARPGCLKRRFSCTEVIQS